MRGWIVAGLVVLAVSSVGVQSDGDAQDDMTHASDAVSRAEQARLRQVRDAAAQMTPRVDDTATASVETTHSGSMPGEH
ncbi:hypothetical protein [Luteimonas fraxinea]|uniref:hypothetical protein n=1 Tax=Luteimonas fraxinea TaxID=2901869 RepID=UPI001E64FC3A|nr:hypothetical protein [Luteimonas fraxinea]MCD9124821.1 hypothetical protein [Luteimonas fraxinea]